MTFFPPLLPPPSPQTEAVETLRWQSKQSQNHSLGYVYFRTPRKVTSAYATDKDATSVVVMSPHSLVSAVGKSGDPVIFAEGLADEAETLLEEWMSKNSNPVSAQSREPLFARFVWDERPFRTGWYSERPGGEVQQIVMSVDSKKLNEQTVLTSYPIATLESFQVL